MHLLLWLLVLGRENRTPMRTEPRQESPMQQRAIDFRKQLERLLPLDELTTPDRFRVRRALETGITAPLEEAARYALARLEASGAARRVPVAENGGRALHWQSRDSLGVITLELPPPREREGLQLVPRSSSTAQAQAGLDQMRELLRLDEAVLAADPRSGQARRGLLEQLDHTGRELLGASEVRFVPAGDEGAGLEPLAPQLAAEAFRRPDVLLYCPDTEKCPALAAEGRRRRIRSVVISAVSPGGGPPLGLLEVLARRPGHFAPGAVAMVALLADSCGGVLERAARIEKLVFIDPLTAIYNRSYFDLQLRNEMARARRERNSMALCIADIDDFKSFNSVYGFAAANRVLVQVAHALQHGVRPFDTVARWGGEEFAVLLTAPVHAHDVVAASERLRALVERLTVEVEDLDRRRHHVGVTVSMGVSLYPDHALGAEDLWRAANQALLRAKRPPKNRVVFYSAGLASDPDRP
jgi:diguanylate cyclase (GGDEF)-like protein